MEPAFGSQRYQSLEKYTPMKILLTSLSSRGQSDFTYKHK